MTEDECEAPTRRITRSSELPPSIRDSIRRVERLDTELRERERSHQVTRTVAPLVPVENGLPASRQFVTGDERGRVRSFIPVHETFDVPAIPGCLLRLNDGTHVFHDLFGVFRRIH